MTPTVGESHRLADLVKFACGLRYEALPAEVIEKAKQLAVDQFGVSLACAGMPASRAAYGFVTELAGRPESTVYYYGDKVPAAHAAFANGTFGFGFENDDWHRPSNLHPGNLVIPTALAMAESSLASGRDFLTAVVVGYEVLIRIALAVVPSVSQRGYHATGITGAFAAAAVAGKMMGFNAETMQNAISLGVTACSGITEGTQQGSHLKRMFCGTAASGGIRAALLAKHGMTAPASALEGKFGFCRVYAPKYDLEQINDGLGSVYKILDTTHKIYCCDGYIQPVIDAIMTIRKRATIRPSDVKEVVIGNNQHAINITGAIVEPKDIAGAQTSTPFGVGLAIVKGGGGFRDYVEENLRDPEIIGVAKLVRMEPDKELEKKFPAARGAAVTIKMKDGTIHEERIDDMRRLTRDEIHDKVRDRVGLVMPQGRADRIIDAVVNLDKQPNVTQLSRSLIL